MTNENVLNLDQPEAEGVKPVFIQTLYDLLGTHAKVGQRIGCTSSTVSKAIQDDDIALQYELAAGFILGRDFPQPAKKYVLISAPEHVIKTIMPLITASNGTCREI